MPTEPKDPAQMTYAEASKPKEPKNYSGWSYKGRKCPKHKVALVKDDHECCGCCCSGCEPEWSCPKCKAAYDRAYAKWFRQFGHLVAVGQCLGVQDGKIVRYSPDIAYMQFLHGGKPIKIGSWCKVDGKSGHIVRTTKPWTTPMLVIS